MKITKTVAQVATILKNGDRTFSVASQEEMLASGATKGDIAIRTDISKSFRLKIEPATLLSNWSELLVLDFIEIHKNSNLIKKLQNPNAYIENFNKKSIGTADGQGFKVYDSTGEIVGNTLEVKGIYTTATSTVIENLEFNEGKIRILVNPSYPKWMIGFRYKLSTRERYGIWDTGTALSFGWRTDVGTVAKYSTITRPSENYYVEVLCPTLYVGAIIEVRVWGISTTRPSTATYTYTLQSGDPIYKEKLVCFHSTDGTTPAKIYEILVCKGLGFKNKPMSQGYFSGRWANFIYGQNTDTMCTINQGSEIYTELENTTSVVANFTINANQTPYIAYSVDGGAYTRVIVASTITIATGLSYGKHIIKIVASGIDETDDTWNKGRGILFNGYTVDLGGTAIPYVPKLKPILFIGDSITAGVRVLGTVGNAAMGAGEQAYPHITCNLLQALPIQVGFGATGVTHAGNGNVPSAINFVDYMMGDKYENAEYPVAIVVNQTTNDTGVATSTVKTAYQALVTKLQAKYTHVPIFCVDPFTSHEFSTQISEVVTATPGTYYVPTTDWGITTTDALHPNVDGHITAGTKLAEFIKYTLGQEWFL